MTWKTQLPKISIVIPTKNSARTLRLCLKSIMLQRYPQKLLEVIVVDSYSSDDTVSIARKYGCRVISTRLKPMGARYIGYLNSRGDIIVFLDSDHILAYNGLLLDIAYHVGKGCDIIHLEEMSFKPRTLVQKLIADDRYTTQAISKLLPLPYGTLYPRVFKRSILEKVYESMPRNILTETYEHEEVILHYEALRMAKRHCSIPKALFHVDEESFKHFLKKIEGYGCMHSLSIMRVQKYAHAISSKRLFRLREIPYLFYLYPTKFLKVLLLLGLKALAYKHGELRCRCR